MPNESGDMKLLTNFRKLIDLVSADADYKPSNALLKKAALEAQYAAALTAVQDIATTQATSKTAINDRETAFDALRSLMTRVHNLAKASGASGNLLADLNTSKRKLTGQRKSAKVKPDPKAPNAQLPKQISASQMSYGNQIGNFGGYVALLSELASYNPSEADLKLTALKALAADLQAKHDAVSAAFVPLSQSRSARDQLLYQADTSVVNAALLSKNYVNAAFGSSSALYKQIKGLRFDRNKKTS